MDLSHKIDQAKKFEPRIRKRWLRWHVFSSIFSLVVYCFECVVRYGLPGVEEGMWSLLLGMVFMFLGIFCWYYFPYKKKGTKLLSLFLWTFPLSLLLGFKVAVHSFPHMAYFLTSTILTSLLYHASIDLRRINKIHKYKNDTAHHETTLKLCDKLIKPSHAAMA